MSVSEHVRSDHQLARLLQIGIVLEEVVEARAYHHYHSLSDEWDGDLDGEIIALLEHAREESAKHRAQLEELVAELDAASVPFAEIEQLVERKYGQTRPEDFDGVLYDQLASEETAYKFYDDVIEAIENSDVEFSVEVDRLVGLLESIREDEADGVEEVTELMEQR